MAQEKNYDECYAELEAIIERLNRGGLSLDELREHTTRADTLIRRCNDLLRGAEQEIEDKIGEWEELIKGNDTQQ